METQAFKRLKFPTIRQKSAKAVNQMIHGRYYGQNRPLYKKL